MNLLKKIIALPVLLLLATSCATEPTIQVNNGYKPGEYIIAAVSIERSSDIEALSEEDFQQSRRVIFESLRTDLLDQPLYAHYPHTTLTIRVNRIIDSTIGGMHIATDVTLRDQNTQTVIWSEPVYQELAFRSSSVPQGGGLAGALFGIAANIVVSSTMNEAMLSKEELYRKYTKQLVNKLYPTKEDTNS